jgi:hypothetical protein
LRPLHNQSGQFEGDGVLNTLSFLALMGNR